MTVSTLRPWAAGPGIITITQQPEEFSVAEARDQFSELVNQAAYAGRISRVTRGRSHTLAAAIVPISLLEDYERLLDAEDGAAATRLDELSRGEAMTSDREYQVGYHPAAAKQLRRLDKTDRRRAERAIADLRIAPRPPGCRKLTGFPILCRVWGGDIRIVYQVEDDQLIILVLQVRPRATAYHSLRQL